VHMLVREEHDDKSGGAQQARPTGRGCFSSIQPLGALGVAR
jgi:hypothetical protein